MTSHKSAHSAVMDVDPAIASHSIASREEWLKERVRLLAKEKAFFKARDALSAEQRALPWVRVEKEYVFIGPAGRLTLGELFANRSQLFIKHFMMAPGQEQQCVGCSLEVDHLAGILVHLENHDVAYAAVARAPFEEIEALRKGMDWHFPFVSSFGSDFNYDFNVSFTPEQVASGTALYNFRQTDPGLADLSGNSVFFKDDDDQIFHTYSTFGRGGEQFLGVYGFFDVTPKGRDETRRHSLTDWARPHNQYDDDGSVEASGRYHSSNCDCPIHR